MASPPPPTLLSVSLRSQPMANTATFFGQCSSVKHFEKIGRVGEGTYGVVYKARDSRSQRLVALKRIRMDREQDGLPISSLREIALLRSLRHENIVKVMEVAVGSKLDDIFMVLELCETDLAHLMDQVIPRMNPSRFTERANRIFLTHLQVLMPFATLFTPKRSNSVSPYDSLA
ncbi:Cyclin-dependent kinase 10 [Podochytrium sp. JEL0797]|nr:Cyclin-dependent kinase 10 [Podochytrium sp. JEL0797]